MLFPCWANVVDVGPALKQHWVNASCLFSGKRSLLELLNRPHGRDLWLSFDLQVAPLEWKGWISHFIKW